MFLSEGSCHVFDPIIVFCISTIGRDVQAITWPFRADLFSLLLEAGNFSKILSGLGQHEIQSTEVQMNKYKHNFTCVFFYIMHNNNVGYWQYQEKW
jgi:hypothetical protein